MCSSMSRDPKAYWSAAVICTEPSLCSSSVMRQCGNHLKWILSGRMAAACSALLFKRDILASSIRYDRLYSTCAVHGASHSAELCLRACLQV